MAPHQKNYSSNLESSWSDDCYDRRWGQWYPCSSRSELLHRDGWRRSRNPSSTNIVLLNSDFNDVPEFFWRPSCGEQHWTNRSNLLYQNDLFLPLGYHLYPYALFFNVNYLLIFTFSLFKSPWSTNSSKGSHHCVRPLNAISNRLKSSRYYWRLAPWWSSLVCICAAFWGSKPWLVCSRPLSTRLPSLPLGSIGFLSVIQASLPINIGGPSSSSSL